MATITELIKELRAQTGAGVLDCKRALESTNGDLEEAAQLLRLSGLAAAAKKAEREASEGLIGYYVHTGSKVAAMVELNCESDFVARTDAFQELAKDLAMQVVAARPAYVERGQVPAAVIEEETSQTIAEHANSGKPGHIVDKIVEGRLEKYYQEACLLEQPFIKDGSTTVGELVNQAIARLGENIVVRRFARFEVGA